MKKYLVAAALIVAFATPALAEEIYVVYDNMTKKCVTMATKPTDMTKYKMMGTYPTIGDAETAMRTMTDCK